MPNPCWKSHIQHLGGGKGEQQGQGTHLSGLGHMRTHALGNRFWSLLSVWFIEWTWTHSPVSLGSGQMSKPFSVLKKSVSICPVIAAPLCINICAFLGTHTWIWVSHMTTLTSRLLSRAMNSQRSRKASTWGVCPKTCYRLRYWKPAFSVAPNQTKLKHGLNTDLLYCILPHKIK